MTKEIRDIIKLAVSDHIKSGLEEVKLLLEGSINVVAHAKQIEHEFYEIASHLGIEVEVKNGRNIKKDKRTWIKGI